MARITFIQPDGSAATVDVPTGLTVMEGAIDNDITGVIAQCGGSCSCSTCHCYVSEDWMGALTPAEEEETGLIEFAWEPRESSRLTCQIRVTDELDGLVLHVPAEQL
jgi:2Fe-2S ferredoxin